MFVEIQNTVAIVVFSIADFCGAWISKNGCIITIAFTNKKIIRVLIPFAIT